MAESEMYAVNGDLSIPKPRGVSEVYIVNGDTSVAKPKGVSPVYAVNGDTSIPRPSGVSPIFVSNIESETPCPAGVSSVRIGNFSVTPPEPPEPPEPTNPYYVGVIFDFGGSSTENAIGNFTLDGTAIDMRLIDTSTPVSLNGSFATINSARVEIPEDVLDSIEGTGLVYKSNMKGLYTVLKLDGDNKPDVLGFDFKFKNASWLNLSIYVNTLGKSQDGSYYTNQTIRSNNYFVQTAGVENTGIISLHL